MKPRILEGKVTLTENEGGHSAPTIQIGDNYLEDVFEEMSGLRLSEDSRFKNGLDELEIPGKFKITIEYRKDLIQ